jgi:hypothetical protein
MLQRRVSFTTIILLNFLRTSFRFLSIFFSVVENEDETGGEKEDSYCFELLSMLISLIVSKEGRAFLASKALVQTLLSLLPVATIRIQRLIVPILQRSLIYIRPETLSSFASQHESSLVREGGVIHFLLLCAAKPLKIQLRGRTISKDKGGNEITMDDVSEQSSVGEWLKGYIPSEIGTKIVALLRDVREQSPQWKVSKKQKNSNFLFSSSSLLSLQAHIHHMIPKILHYFFHFPKQHIDSTVHQSITHLKKIQRTIGEGGAQYVQIPMFWIALASLWTISTDR